MTLRGTIRETTDSSKRQGGFQVHHIPFRNEFQKLFITKSIFPSLKNQDIWTREQYTFTVLAFKGNMSLCWSGKTWVPNMQWEVTQWHGDILTRHFPFWASLSITACQITASKCARKISLYARWKDGGKIRSSARISNRKNYLVYAALQRLECTTKLLHCTAIIVALVNTHRIAQWGLKKCWSRKLFNTLFISGQASLNKEEKINSCSQETPQSLRALWTSWQFFHLWVNQPLTLQQLIKDINMELRAEEKAAEAQPEISWHDCRPIRQSMLNRLKSK